MKTNHSHPSEPKPSAPKRKIKPEVSQALRANLKRRKQAASANASAQVEGKGGAGE